MNNIDVKVPADANTVTLEIKRGSSFTLRSLLPNIHDDVELVVVDFFCELDTDQYRLKADSGDALLHKLMRSRVVDGESILDLTPVVKFGEPKTSRINGAFVTLPGTGYIQLVVQLPVSED